MYIYVYTYTITCTSIFIVIVVVFPQYAPVDPQNYQHIYIIFLVRD